VSVVDEAQLLIQEAKQHRRRRRLLTGAVSFMVVVALVVASVVLSTGSGGRGSSTAPASPTPIATAAASAANLSFRPVLCYAAPLAVATGAAATTGPLPTCAPSSLLTAANLSVAPDANGTATGYTGPSNVPVDSQFAAYPSTSSANDRGNQTVLLAMAGGSVSDDRYVLGPAGLTASGVKSATAALVDRQWVVNLALTSRGSAQWDALARDQFHALIAVVINGKVVSAPLTQPAQSSYTSFAGRVQISGTFTRAQAKAVAARI
jgi:hypothetical protein